jgi:hypothetical protein
VRAEADRRLADANHLFNMSLIQQAKVIHRVGEKSSNFFPKEHIRELQSM